MCVVWGSCMQSRRANGCAVPAQGEEDEEEEEGEDEAEEEEEEEKEEEDLDQGTLGYCSARLVRELA